MIIILEGVFDLKLDYKSRR